MAKKYISLLLSILFFVESTCFAAGLSQKTLQNDLAYYKKLSAQKNFSPTDRSSLLTRIETKYKDSSVDLAPLKSEMEKLKADPRAPAGETTPKEKILAAVSEPSRAQPPEATYKDYVIQAGDILAVSVLPAQELSREVVVQPDGNIAFPLIGSLLAKGSTSRELEIKLRANLKKYVANPTIKVTIKKFSGMQILITGEVKAVGSFNYTEKVKLMQFISSIGGFTNDANRQAIKIYRGTQDKRTTFTVNIEDMINSGDFSRDFVLEPGDIIEVPKGNPKVSILGDVRNPGYYEHKENMRLLELVSLAGGFTDEANLGKITIINEKDTASPKKIREVNLKNVLSGKQPDILIEKGDTVYFPKKSIASANWFVNNVMPWLTLISLVIVIRGGV
jgi:polysaccharide biosynthesis/export protein